MIFARRCVWRSIEGTINARFALHIVFFCAGRHETFACVAVQPACLAFAIFDVRICFAFAALCADGIPRCRARSLNFVSRLANAMRLARLFGEKGRVRVVYAHFTLVILCRIANDDNARSRRARLVPQTVSDAIIGATKLSRRTRDASRTAFRSTFILLADPHSKASRARHPCCARFAVSSFTKGAKGTLCTDDI